MHRRSAVSDCLQLASLRSECTRAQRGGRSLSLGLLSQIPFCPSGLRDLHLSGCSSSRMLSSSNPGILLAKLKSRGLSGLAVRHHRASTSSEFDHPHLEDESPVHSFLSHSPGHAETGADLSPSSTAVSSPVHVSRAEPSSPAHDEHPRTVSSPERFAPGAAGLSSRSNVLACIASLI